MIGCWILCRLSPLSLLFRAATKMFVSMKDNYCSSSSSRDESVSMPQSGGFCRAFQSGSSFQLISVFFSLAFETSWLKWLMISFALLGSFVWASPFRSPRVGGCGFEWTHDFESVIR